MCNSRMASKHDSRNYHRSSHGKDSWEKQDVRSKTHDRQSNGPSSRKHREEKQREDSAETKPKLRQCGDWSEYISSSGKKYYYHCKTEVSQWEKPKEWLDFERSDSSNNRKPASSSSHGSISASSNHQHSVSGFKNQLSSRQSYSKNCDSVSDETAKCGFPESSSSALDDFRLPSNSTPVESLQPASRKRKDYCVSDSQTNSPKRLRATNDRDGLNNSLTVTDEASCSNDGNGDDSAVQDTATDVDLQRLPELLVEIAEKYNIDLTHPDALEKLKHYLKSTLAEQTDVDIDEDTKVEPDTVPVSTVMEMSPETSVGSDSANHQLEVPSLDQSSSEENVLREKDQLELLCPMLPPVSPSLAAFHNAQLATHASGWLAEHFERQARVFSDEAFRRGCLDCAQVSADLKCARSLVRTAEIRATLLEQRVLFLQQQNAILDTSKASTAAST